LGVGMGLPKRKISPVFGRVLKGFESMSELARQAGVERSVVHYWTRLGYIPADRALVVSMACASGGVKVSVAELLREAELGKAKVMARGGARVVRMLPVELAPGGQ
jgi:transposase-like protein